MKAHTISLTLAAAIAILGAGCASSSAPPPAQYPSARTYPAVSPGDPNQTARGAAAGAVAGAVIGGIIGNNSSGDTEKGAAVGAVAGGLAGAAIGHRADQREANARGSADYAYSVQSIPPAPVSEPYDNPPPQPSPNAVWIRGHYAYTGSGYQWQPGRWEVPPPGARVWMQPQWQPGTNGGYVYVRGHWQ